MPSVVFMHVGDGVQLPTILVRSIRRHNPTFDIVQVTDLDSPQIEGVTHLWRMGPFDGELMTFRLKGFAGLTLDGPAWYFDTDMICLAPLSFDGGSGAVAVCERSFKRDAPFATTFQEIDFSEYAGMTYGQVYPYLACATRVDGSNFWRLCLEELYRLPPKFRTWFGDQEAMRNVIQQQGFKVDTLPERTYACLPEHFANKDPVQMMHYKGVRKLTMFQHAEHLGLL